MREQARPAGLARQGLTAGQRQAHVAAWVRDGLRAGMHAWARPGSAARRARWTKKEGAPQQRDGGGHGAVVLYRCGQERERAVRLAPGRQLGVQQRRAAARLQAARQRCPARARRRSPPPCGDPPRARCLGRRDLRDAALPGTSRPITRRWPAPCTDVACARGEQAGGRESCTRQVRRA